MIRNLIPILLAVILLTALTTAPLHTQSPSSLPGDWIGTLKIRSAELRVVFHIAKSDGGYSATLDSPDQSAKGIPVKSIAVEGDSLHLDVTAVAGSFAGKILSDTLIDGMWKQGGMSLPLALKPLKEPLITARPQEPKRPYPYDEEEVTIENPEGKATLAGTLTLPRGVRSAPAVVLISGSGPQDRDETIFGHKPFLILADYLTRRGIAVLRCDDRGVGKSKGDRSKATSLDFMGDALAALRSLRGRAGIDSNRVGFIGHSEGALIAPMAAARTPQVAFIVMLAGPGVTGDSVLIRQAALISRAEGADEETIRANNAMQRKLFRVLEQEPDSAKAVERLTAVMRETLAAAPDSSRRRDAADSAGIAMQAAQLNSRWFRFFLRYDPRTDLRKLKIPVLALNGEKDLQVSYEQNLPEIEKALKEAGNTRFTVRMLRGLNHLFQTAKTGSVTEYGKNEETMSPLALRAIGDWIRQVAGKR